MISAELIKKIKIYAVASFLVPLIAVNSCLIIYSFLGYVGENIAKFPNINWNVEKIELSPTTFYPKHSYEETFTYTNCPKYNFSIHFITTDNETVTASAAVKVDTLGNQGLIAKLEANNKIKSKIDK